MRTRTALSMFAGTVLLAACGGGNDSPAPPQPTDGIPASAGASVAGYDAYVLTLTATQPETLEPFTVGSFQPPTDDTIEPMPITQ